MMVKSYPNMEEIMICFTIVTDEDLELSGGHLKNLRGLTLLECSGFSTVGLSSIVANCRNLRKLCLICFDLNYVGLLEIFAKCKQLQELVIRNFGESNLTVQSLISIVMSCPKLHSIEFKCSLMTNAALFTIANQLPNLSHFDITLHELSIYHLTDEPLDAGFTTILERCKNLKHLEIKNLVITERLLENIGTHGKKLERLHLSSVWGFDSRLHRVVSDCTNLKSLVAIECDFGDQALLTIGCWLETLFLRMDGCPVKYRVCKLLHQRYPRLRFLVNDERMSLVDVADESLVFSVMLENIYVICTWNLFL